MNVPLSDKELNLILSTIALGLNLLTDANDPESRADLLALQNKLMALRDE